MRKMKNVKRKIVAIAFAMMMGMGLLSMAMPAKAYAASVDAAGAKSIALKDAGYQSSSVKRLTCKQDSRGTEYIVKFKKGKYTYRYEIKKNSGRIDEMSRKLTKVKKSSGNKEISKEKATKIAFKKLGIKSARDLDREREIYRGAKVWEVSFDKGNYDYEFKIDRYSGKILYMEKERD